MGLKELLEDRKLLQMSKQLNLKKPNQDKADSAKFQLQHYDFSNTSPKTTTQITKNIASNPGRYSWSENYTLLDKVDWTQINPSDMTNIADEMVLRVYNNPHPDYSTAPIAIVNNMIEQTKDEGLMRDILNDTNIDKLHQGIRDKIATITTDPKTLIKTTQRYYIKEGAGILIGDNLMKKIVNHLAENRNIDTESATKLISDAAMGDHKDEIKQEPEINLDLSGFDLDKGSQL